MKKAYKKPMIYIERFQMDNPIAANCKADFDDMNSLLDLGYFMEEYDCMIMYPNDGSIPGSMDDTICYHSNVQTAFLS